MQGRPELYLFRAKMISQNKLRHRYLFFLAIAIILAIFLVSFAKAIPSPSIRSNITFSQTPLIDTNTNLTISLWSVFNETNISANITLPNGIELVNGSLQWNANLIENIASNHTLTIKVNSTGEFLIESYARSPLQNGSYKGTATRIYLQVNNTATTVSYIPFQDLYWNYTKLAINTSYNPSNSTEYNNTPTMDVINVTLLRPLLNSTFLNESAGPEGAGTITVNGRFLFEKRDGNDYSARYITAQLWDDDILSGDDLLGTVLTDVNGFFSIGPVDNTDGEGGTQDIYVRFIAASSVGSVRTIFDNYYDAYTSTFENVQDGNFNIGTWTQPSNEPEPWWFYDDILTTWLYFANDADPPAVIGSVKVIWPDGEAFYDADDEEIHIGHGFENDQDIVWHEYGHHVMNDLYTNPPFGFCPSPHYIEFESNQECAWSEGWATFVVLFVGEDPFFNFLGGSYDFEDDSDFSWWDEGDAVEGRITASLWDFSDDDSEDDFDGESNDDVWFTFQRQDDDELIEYWSAWSDDHTPEQVLDGAAALAQNTIYYALTEVSCSNGVDDDNDGFTDCADGDCAQGSQSANGFCCGSGCSTNGGTCADASTSGFTCSDGSCNVYGEACQNGELESNLLCSGTSLSCSGGSCEENFGAPDSCDEITPGDNVCENSNGPYDERACEISGTNCYLEAEFQCLAPADCDEKGQDECSDDTGFQCEWQTSNGDNVVEECELSCGAIAQCDELTPGSNYNRCDTAGETYFADECSGSCGGQDRDNICRSSGSLGVGDGCTADLGCNGQEAGTGNCTSTCVYTGGGDFAPLTTLINPQNNSLDDDGIVNFGCSATDDYSLKNITLYGSWNGGWHANETKQLSGTSDSATFNLNLNNGTYIWNCLTFDNSSQSDWGDSNYTLIVNITNSAPTIPLIIHPNGGEVFEESLIDINWSISNDPDGDFVMYYLQYSNNSGANWYNMISNYGYENKLNDSSIGKELIFSGNENKTVYIRVPKQSIVTNAELELEGWRI